MCASPAITSLHNEESNGFLPRSIAHQIDHLMQTRVEDYIAEVYRSARTSGRPTELEQSVDALLDSLTTLHRLEELARCTAGGYEITVEADRLLIAQNGAMYRKMVEFYAAKEPQRAVVSTTLLPYKPVSIE